MADGKDAKESKEYKDSKDGKQSEGKKKEDLKDLSKLLELVQDFCVSSNFEKEFETFAKKSANVFLPEIESKKQYEEYPLAYYDVYKEYLAKFEKMIEQFIISNGFTLNDFYNECQKVMEEEELFGSKRFFIETMLAISEFENFLTLMKSEIQGYLNNSDKNKK